MPECLLDTDTLSSVMKGANPVVRGKADAYVTQYGPLSFSIITQYEILRGLKAKRATRQILGFERQCSVSRVLPLDDSVVRLAADIYADLRGRGQLIGDADILIAATALMSKLALVTDNARHFERIPGLVVESWTR